MAVAEPIGVGSINRGVLLSQAASQARPHQILMVELMILHFCAEPMQERQASLRHPRTPQVGARRLERKCLRYLIPHM